MKRTAIIYVHGHMGSRRQFSPLISLLPNDGSVDHYNISLPGHDGTITQFERSHRKEWQKYVNDLITKKKKEYEELILVGHSMGGLLLINAAIAHPDKIRAIIAIAMPLYVKATIRGINIRLRSIGNARSGESECISCARELNGVSGVNYANSYRLIPNTLGLFRIMKGTRHSLHKLTVPLTIINSVNDEIVSMKTVRTVEKVLPDVKTVVLAQSSHFWFSSDEVKLIKDQIDMFLNTSM